MFNVFNSASKKITQSDAKRIPSQKYAPLTIEGQKFSKIKTKYYFKDLLKGGKTASELKKELKIAGVVGRQMRNREKDIELLSGGEKKDLNPRQKAALAAGIKARIAASRYTAEKVGERSGGMAGHLMNRDGKSRVGNILSEEAKDPKGGKIKIGAGALDIQGRNYNVTAHAGGRSISNTNKSGFANTPSQATGLTGDHGAGHIPQSGTHNPLR